MIRKVIYVNYQPFSDKYYVDYYIQECIENGLEVEYWDVTNLYFPQNNFQESSNLNLKVLKIFNFKDFKNKISLSNKETTLFITNITYEFSVWKLFRIFTIYNCKLAFFARGMFPTPAKKASLKILQIISSMEFRKVSNVLKNYVALFFKKYKIIKTYDCVFRAGSDGGATIGIGYQYDMHSSKIIEINYFDYDKYLQVSNEPSYFQGDYCVFLDVYLPYHPDVKIMGIKTVAPETYFHNLNLYFEFIEKKYKTNVIICAHPKAHNYKTENPFNGRKIVFNKTCEFVKEARFTITNYSTSISFPILFKKPIIFISSDEEKEKMFNLYETTLHLGEILNSKVSQFDKIDINSENDLFVDHDLYLDYKYKYLTSKESKNNFTSKIFIEAILKM